MTPLESEIRAIIAQGGPISVARYMSLCATHPKHGYYMTRDPFGAHGDFMTAPEISQMFGELIGLWAAAVWDAMGRPNPMQLIELGPGRGTLMADALRALRTVPELLGAASVCFVEASPVLRARQQAALAGFPRVTWHESFDAIPNERCIVIANEFVDALPVHQAVRGPRGFHERLVGIADDGALCFMLAAVPMQDLDRHAPEGAIIEWRSDAFPRMLAERIVAKHGAALLIDYGYRERAPGETLQAETFQAMSKHAFVDPLREPGEADLTAHVDFGALARIASRVGARVHGPIGQGLFLRRLGIEARAAQLKQNATAEQKSLIDSALTRLTGSADDAMGVLFKAIAFSHPDFAILPGFAIEEA